MKRTDNNRLMDEVVSVFNTDFSKTSIAVLQRLRSSYTPTKRVQHSADEGIEAGIKAMLYLYFHKLIKDRLGEKVNNPFNFEADKW